MASDLAVARDGGKAASNLAKHGVSFAYATRPGDGAVRALTGLSQARFARAYRINVARLRDLEQGRTRPDSALLAYLAVIDREPAAVERALGRRDRSPA